MAQIGAVGMVGIQKIIKAAERGNPRAQSALGEMYEEGRGIPQDYTASVKWYRKAAERGFAKAQFHLGAMYEVGHGVEVDKGLAHMWFNLAGSQGFEDATKARDSLAINMPSEQIAEAQKLAREWRPQYRRRLPTH